MTTAALYRAPALAFMLAALAACEGGMMGGPFAAASGDGFTPIASEEAFRAEVVGREVLYANGAVGAYGADGTWTVTQGDAVIGDGVWTWTDAQWCREGRTADGPVPAACEDVAVSADAIRFTRADGSQGTLPFRG